MRSMDAKHVDRLCIETIPGARRSPGRKARTTAAQASSTVSERRAKLFCARKLDLRVRPFECVYEHAHRHADEDDSIDHAVCVKNEGVKTGSAKKWHRTAGAFTVSAVGNKGSASGTPSSSAK
jgi:hypothetical protein